MNNQEFVSESELVTEYLDQHQFDLKSAIAWAIRHIDRLEQNNIRQALARGETDHSTTLKQQLKYAIAQRQQYSQQLTQKA